MWRPWGKSSVKIHDTYSPTKAVAPSSPSFSFKDIHHLCTDDSSAFTPSSPKNPNRVFHRVLFASSVLLSWPTRPSSQNQLLRSDSEPVAPRLNQETSPRKPKLEPDVWISVPGADKSVVVYFTSLRVVRTTFEECKAVRSILRGFRVRMDERDLAMDGSFAGELRGIFGEEEEQKLPRVFIGGRYVGGGEEVKQLHEMGELKKMVEGMAGVEAGDCEGCGGQGFVPCDECHGSHKLYSDKLGFRTCFSCNENGLIRCPSCSSHPSSDL
ncbi:PREDICTED: uncharacterized protein At5g39865 [Tarenaya hassleriana]|uniref:uncharacterized protein At5g39865 n=1 Tax=Tarenaya hassleriana TaxID=28532 RepID=UPI00053C711C|nr:PREDICTED: uncharacterized protein At5g39865 [Tarenaya hassleriana]